MTAPALGYCDGCGRLKQLRADGTVPRHYHAITVSRRVVPLLGRGRVRRRCSGSGRPPRRRAP
jgi:hypothetical protein